MTITKEQAKADLERVMGTYGTLGPGSELDRAAQLVMQPIGVLERRLDRKSLIRGIYFDMQDSSKLLPPAVYDVAKEYVEGKIEESVARQRLQEIEVQYEEVFRDMGLSPQVSKALFGKF